MKRILHIHKDADGISTKRAAKYSEPTRSSALRPFGVASAGSGSAAAVTGALTSIGLAAIGEAGSGVEIGAGLAAIGPADTGVPAVTGVLAVIGLAAGALAYG